MTAYEAIMARRTIRKFKQTPVPKEVLIKLADCGRMSASAANLQPIKYALIDKPELTEKIFPLTKWAGYLADGTPKDGEKPPAYIAVIGDDSINKNALENEAGLVMSSIMIAACGEGLGTCCLGAIQRDKINALLALPENLHTLYLIAVGFPAQNSRAEDISGKCKYFETDDGIVVPKRPLSEIIIDC